MGKVDDFISSLEGQENLDLTAIVGNLLELHNEEMQTSTSKIAEMSAALDMKNATIAERDADIVKWKAKNWDLANQIPAPESNTPSNDGDMPHPSDVTFDDLFEN